MNVLCKLIITKEEGEKKMKKIRIGLLLLLLVFTVLGKDNGDIEPELNKGLKDGWWRASWL